MKRNQQKLKFFISLLLGAIFLSHTSLSWAVSPVPEATPTDEAVLGEKVKEIRDAVKEKVREKLAEVKKGQKKAFVGEIIEISDTTLTLETRGGESQIQVATDAAILNTNKEEIDFEDLAIGNFTIAMGFLDENSILQAIRLVIIKKPALVVRRVAFGVVTDISKDEMLTIKNEKKDIIYSVETTGKTMITKKVDGKIEKVTFEEIAVGDRVIAVGKPEENNDIIITARHVHVIPGLNKPTPTSETESPSPTEIPEE